MCAASCVGGHPSSAAAWLAEDAADRPDRRARRRRALQASAPFGFRYQYLAGGVNTGSGWATWNPDGSFVTRYVPESWAARDDPGLHLLPAAPVEAGRTGGEAHADLANLDNAATMAGVLGRRRRLFFQRARRARRPVVLHVEPDLWGYIEQAATGDDAATRSGGRPRRAAAERGRLRPGVRARCATALAPNVILAYHMSGWGTEARHRSTRSPPDATVRRLRARARRPSTARSARAFDVSFEDFSDRDAGFYADGRAQPDSVVHAAPTSPPPALRGALRRGSRASGWSRGRSRSATP